MRAHARTFLSFDLNVCLGKTASSQMKYHHMEYDTSWCTYIESQASSYRTKHANPHSIRKTGQSKSKFDSIGVMDLFIHEISCDFHVLYLCIKQLELTFFFWNSNSILSSLFPTVDNIKITRFFLVNSFSRLNDIQWIRSTCIVYLYACIYTYIYRSIGRQSYNEALQPIIAVNIFEPHIDPKRIDIHSKLVLTRKD